MSDSEYTGYLMNYLLRINSQNYLHIELFTKNKSPELFETHSPTRIDKNFLCKRVDLLAESHQHMQTPHLASFPLNYQAGINA